MSRRRAHEEHENHERWLVSYADFITLLFAFFVVMYATSSVDVIRHQEISKALIKLFDHPEATTPIELKPDGALIELPVPQAQDAEAEAIEALEAIAEQIQSALGDEIAQLAKSSTAMAMVALRTQWRAWHFQRSRMCLALLAKQSRVRAEMKPR